MKMKQTIEKENRVYRLNQIPLDLVNIGQNILIKVDRLKQIDESLEMINDYHDLCPFF